MLFSNAYYNILLLVSYMILSSITGAHFVKSLDLSTTSPGFDFFLAVHSHNFFADMATSTNAYAAMHGGRLWLDTTDDKMHFFFGILILMGVNRDY